MSTEQLAEMIEKLPPERRALVIRLIEELVESPAAAASIGDAGEVGILKHIGKYHLGGVVGGLTAEELHGDD
jgi:hypothetical protein